MLSRIVLRGLVILGLCWTTGCVSYRTPLSPSSALPNNMACLYGRFSFSDQTGLRLALVLTETASKKQHRIRFANGSGLAVIDVPPGEYSVTHYTAAMLMAMSPGEWSNVAYSPSIADALFRVEAGHIYYIGDYVGAIHKTVLDPRLKSYTVGYNASIDECRNNYEETTKELKTNYPRLRALPAVSVAK